MAKICNIKLNFLIVFLIVYSLRLNAQTAISSPKLEKAGVGYGYMCARSDADVFPINFTFQGDNFKADNVFYVQLSDASGNFDNPKNIATITGKNNIYYVEANITLPKSVYGKNYRIQIASTSPKIISDPSVNFAAYYIGDVKRPILNEGNDVVLCSSDPIEISLDDPDKEYRWYKNGELQKGLSGSKIKVNSSGSYYAEPDYGKCISISSNIVKVTNFNGESLNIKGDNEVSVCGSESYTFESTIVKTSSYDYFWYKNGVLIKDANKPSYTTSTSNQFGVYQVKLKPKGGGACEISSQEVTLSSKSGSDFKVNLKVPSEIVWLPTTQEIVGVSHNASGSVSIQWFRDGIKEPGAVDASISVIKPGVYHAEVTEISGECPLTVKSDEITVVRPKQLVPLISADESYESCTSSKTNITISGVEAIDEDNNRYSLRDDQIKLLKFKWFKDDIELADKEGEKQIEVSSYKENGGYKVEAGFVKKSLNGVSEVLEVNLAAIKFELISSSTSNVLCPGVVITLAAKPYNKDFTYIWFNGEEQILTSDPSSIEVTEIGNYVLKVDGFGCEKRIEVEIIEFDDDAVNISPSTTAVLGQDGTVVITASGGESYKWYDIDGNVLSTSESVEVDQLGTYKLESKSGICNVVKEIQVVEDDGSIIIPNVLTPFNGDGINDTWQIPNKYAFQQNVNVIIYDSRGKEVLNTTDYQNNWPEVGAVKGGMLFYFKVIRDQTLIKAGTLSVLK